MLSRRGRSLPPSNTYITCTHVHFSLFFFIISKRIFRHTLQCVTYHEKRFLEIYNGTLKYYQICLNLVKCITNDGDNFCLLYIVLYISLEANPSHDIFIRDSSIRNRHEILLQKSMSFLSEKLYKSTAFLFRGSYIICDII